jgi:hypothetical protein
MNTLWNPNSEKRLPSGIGFVTRLNWQVGGGRFIVEEHQDLALVLMKMIS